MLNRFYCHLCPLGNMSYTWNHQDTVEKCFSSVFMSRKLDTQGAHLIFSFRDLHLKYLGWWWWMKNGGRSVRCGSCPAIVHANFDNCTTGKHQCNSAISQQQIYEYNCQLWWSDHSWDSSVQTNKQDPPCVWVWGVRPGCYSPISTVVQPKEENGKIIMQATQQRGCDNSHLSASIGGYSSMSWPDIKRSKLRWQCHL